jgi:hypothetical protein
MAYNLVYAALLCQATHIISYRLLSEATGQQQNTYALSQQGERTMHKIETNQTKKQL